MPRILSIDYGKKRTGLAWTDPLQIIATGLDTLPTPQLRDWLAKTVGQEEIEAILVGYPTRMDGSDSHVTEEVRELIHHISTKFPQIHVHKWDERFTSKLAMDALIQSGISKKKRREKGRIDQMSAVLMLQEFLQGRG